MISPFLTYSNVLSNINLIPIDAWIAVFMGLSCKLSFIISLFKPKERFEPPTKIILGDGVFCNSEFLLIFAINRDFDARGVVGRNIPNK